MSRGFFVSTGEGVLVKFRVSPVAKRTSIGGAYGENAIRLRVAAPPVDGRANAETGRFVASVAGVPRSDVAVVRRAASRDNGVLVRGVAAQRPTEAFSGNDSA